MRSTEIDFLCEPREQAADSRSRSDFEDLESGCLGAGFEQ